MLHRVQSDLNRVARGTRHGSRTIQVQGPAQACTLVPYRWLARYGWRLVRRSRSSLLRHSDSLAWYDKYPVSALRLSRRQKQTTSFQCPAAILPIVHKSCARECDPLHATPQRSGGMVILGGLEIVAGGYLYHRYHKNKNEKKRLEREAEQRRHNSFPGAAKPQSCHPPHPQYTEAPHKYPSSRPQPPYPPPHRPYTDPPPSRPHNVLQTSHPQSFMIPRRPLPKQQHAPPPPQVIQPLQRADSMATISRMPVANGYRPSNIAQDAQLPRHQQHSQLSPIPQSPVSSPYGTPGFAVSSPALANNLMAHPQVAIQHGRRQSVDDSWECYIQSPGYAHYAPSVSTALGEPRDDDPPPPYRP